MRDRQAVPEGCRHRAQPPPEHHHQCRSRVRSQEKTIEETRDGLGEGEHFYYYADEFNLSWMPTLKAMWGPKGQQVMIETPAQPKKRYGIGAVNYHTGETVVLIRSRKRRRETAELLEALLEKHPMGTIYVAWDNKLLVCWPQAGGSVDWCGPYRAIIALKASASLRRGNGSSSGRWTPRNSHNGFPPCLTS